VSGDQPGYRVVVRNTSPTAARAIEVVTAIGGRPGVVGNRAGRDGTPIVDGGGLVSIDLPPSIAGTANTAPAEIRITSALWMDGSSSGLPKPAAARLVSDAGQAMQLQFVVELLRGAAAEPAAAADAVTRLRAGLNAMAIEPNPPAIDDVLKRPTVQQAGLTRAEVNEILRSSFSEVKTYVLRDLTTFESGLAASGASRGAAQAAWVKQATERYSAFLSRLTSTAR